MNKVIIAEGKTTNEAINNGLKQLKTTKEHVNIKILEEEKKMFFSILTPRVVKVEMSLKEEKDINKEVASEKNIKYERKTIKLSKEDQNKAESNIKAFLDEFLPQIKENITYEIIKGEDVIKVNIKNSEIGYLIGYRGETLYSLQDIISAVATRGTENRIKVILDIEGYRIKREQTLQELADRMSKIVIRTGKDIKLEPMKPYERKIIHSKLQENEKVVTKSIGEEPRRRIVISIKK